MSEIKWDWLTKTNMKTKLRNICLPLHITAPFAVTHYKILNCVVWMFIFRGFFYTKRKAKLNILKAMKVQQASRKTFCMTVIKRHSLFFFIRQVNCHYYAYPPVHLMSSDFSYFPQHLDVPHMYTFPPTSCTCSATASPWLLASSPASSFLVSSTDN